MTVELSTALRQQLSTLLREAFPDARFDDADLEGLALALQRQDQAGKAGATGCAVQEVLDGSAPADLELCRAELDALARSLSPQLGADHAPVSVALHKADPFSYYWARATHTRKDPPEKYAPFTGELAMVRVTLPASQPRRFSTAIGSVDPGDHLIATLAEANAKYALPLTYDLKRVDLITPPRQLLRFGAISVLLGYRDPAGLPSCFILEAGTALGQPKVLYLGREIGKQINRRTGYSPTAFSCSDNAYTGDLQLEGNEPKRLLVTARDIMGNVSAPPYMELDVAFIKQTGKAENIWPGFLIARAALIVAERKATGLTNTCEDT